MRFFRPDQASGSVTARMPARGSVRGRDGSSGDAAGFTRFGNAVASLCVRKRGAIPAMPTRDEVLAVLA